MSFWKILASGDIIGAFKKLLSLLEKSPELHAFIDQFSSDFGHAALIDGREFVDAIKTGTKITDAALQLVEKLAEQALDTAGHDALAVATNALGVLVRAPQA